jgi:hypothetical protein
MEGQPFVMLCFAPAGLDLAEAIVMKVQGILLNPITLDY